MSDTKFVYCFGKAGTDGVGVSKAILGGKGLGLAQMTSMGLPVPPGFTITTEVCEKYYELNRNFPPELNAMVAEALAKVEDQMESKFGDSENPLLVSVRSGAAVSMPGMMDTVLNLGLNDISVEGLAKKTNNPRMAWDAYRRLMQMFGDVVLQVEKKFYDAALTSIKKKYNCEIDTDLTTENLKEVVARYKEVTIKHYGKPFPQDAKEQLWTAIEAVFGSWNNQRAIDYRRLNDIRGLVGTAVNVQAMVYGNFGEDSGTGVCFTRNPSTGENKFYGEYLINAQGEDVVAGIRTPEPIATLEAKMPAIYKELVDYKNKLEQHYRDMQDIEFTIQEGKLFFLQTRTGKRTAFASIRFAVEMVEEGMITKEESILRVNPNDITQLLLPRFEKEAKAAAKKDGKVIALGLPASPGAAVGQVVFTAKHAIEAAAEGKIVILVREETSPEDVMGMDCSKGILTARGGMTSHAAVVARGMGRCCVSGSKDIDIYEEEKYFTIVGKDIRVNEFDYISVDGFTGEVMLGKVKAVDPEIGGHFEIFMSWVDAIRELDVRTNAETAKDVAKGLELGAQGIGLARTEHMFFEKDRILSIRKMILADTLEERRAALAELLPHQQKDFESIFKLMAGKPVTIRTLDPPLHEFLPHDPAEQEIIGKALGTTGKAIAEKLNKLSEVNPMLGHRGCRLGITYPEITEMQARAIFQAAIAVKKMGIVVLPEVMIPLIGTKIELEDQGAIVRKVASEVFAETNDSIEYMVGTMIEIPRAALMADKVAEIAEFFSFGTNDLTQMTYGYSRDDYNAFSEEYIAKGVLEYDPFEVLDQEGVGQLVKIAVDRGRSTKPKLKCGICGEHGGEPKSVKFCHNVGLDYVSCSPFRVPVARVAAAQAAIENPRKSSCCKKCCCDK